MRLFIAEKPSLARAIADALPAPQRRRALHIECGGADVVAWCAGHILQPAAPEAYDDALKTWRLEDLPIAPREWTLTVSSPELLNAIARWLKVATRVVHAGDPDREGQLLVDEVLRYLGYAGPVDRLLVRDLRPEAVRGQLGALEPNAHYRPLSEAALARQRADWLYGINMTRLYTLLGRAAGYEGVLSVGRVQTPLLGLIVARDRAIAEFRAVPYYVVYAEVRTEGGESFRAVWVPGDAVALDPERRLLAREVAEDVCRRVAGRAGQVTECVDAKKSVAAPLPYSLAALQMDAGARLRMSAHEVLETCQRLYEVHRIVTYPRSDCAYLPAGHHGQARDVLAAIGRQAPAFGPALAKADVTRRSRAWNDKKITAHHAIVPTPEAVAPAPLTESERGLYDLVARRYLAQFYPAYEFWQTTVTLDLAGECFRATGRRVVAEGWKDLVGDAAEVEPAEGSEENSKESSVRLPPLQSGAPVSALEVRCADKRTTPPKPFDDASLIAAMCGAAKFVRNPALKKILTEADGIGTSATRAAILETLFERGYVERVQRVIVSTETGRDLVRSLPEVATTPDMTATWEAAMRTIAEGTHTLDAFLAAIRTQLEGLVAEGRAAGRVAVAAASPAPHSARRSGQASAGGSDRHPRPRVPHQRKRRP